MKSNEIRIFHNDPTAPMTFDRGDMPSFCALEQILYVFWELTPAYRNWQDELSAIGVTSFEYCEEPALVRWIGDNDFAIEM